MSFLAHRRGLIGTQASPLEGGTFSIATINGELYHIHTFTAYNQLNSSTPPQDLYCNKDVTVEYLIVGTGGDSGNSQAAGYYAGGGGGGGVVLGTTTLRAKGTPYKVSVNIVEGNLIGESSLLYDSLSTTQPLLYIQALGGGRGGIGEDTSGKSSNYRGQSGASGGGGGGGFYNAAGAGYIGQGNSGGTGQSGGTLRLGGGGGGAGTAGSGTTPGQGRAINFNGTTTVYGSGGKTGDVPAGTGPGQPHTGSGGSDDQVSGNGGSGVVMIRYKPTTSFRLSADPFIYDVPLLMHMDGANNSTTFTNSSLSSITITRVGNLLIRTAQSKFGGASGYSQGTDHLIIDTTNNPNFDFSKGNCTVECWFLAETDTTGDQILISKDTVGQSFSWCLGIVTSGGTEGLFTITANDGTTGRFSAPATINLNTWYHAAFTYDYATQTQRLFLNGTLIGSTVKAITNNFNEQVTIFAAGATSSNAHFRGYIDELRVTKNIARYTTSFTPQTSAFPNPFT